MNKTKAEIREEILLDLSASLGINITDEGSIALAIVDALIDEIYLLYKQLDYIKEQAYITTSDSSYTDRIAELVNTQRDEFESDDNLKLRAKNSVYRHAGGNIIAIEEAANAVNGVASIDYRPYGFGTGSFIIYLYPQAHTNKYELIERATEAIDEVVSEGVYYEIRTPLETPIDIEMKLNIKEGITISERNNIRSAVEKELRKYFNNFEMNDILYINEIISIAMNQDENILDANIIEYSVGGIIRPLSNTYPANEEQFMSGDIKIN